MPYSQNGWSVIPLGLAPELVPFRWVTGRVLRGDVATVLDYVCARFHAEVEPINDSHSWGYANRQVRGSTDTSNHASGTAVDLNAPAHPLGKRGTFTAAQAARIRQIVRDVDNVIRWGGDYAGRPDEMHFEVNAPATRVRAVADRIRGGAAPVSRPVTTTGGTIPTPTVGRAPAPITPEGLTVADIERILKELAELNRKASYALGVETHPADPRERTPGQQVLDARIGLPETGGDITVAGAIAETKVNAQQGRDYLRHLEGNLAAQIATLTPQQIAAVIPPDLAARVAAELTITTKIGA